MLHSNNDGEGRKRDVWTAKRGRVARRALAATAAVGAAAGLAFATPAFASSGAAKAPHYSGPSIDLVAVTPSPGDTAGAGGVFNIDLGAVAVNAAGNKWLSAANGYKPGILPVPPPGIGHADPFAPGLVVLLSSTPAKAGGPNANLAGVFQLTDVAVSHNGHREVIADWEVGKPGAFGKGNKVTLEAFIVKGTAPGIWTGKATLLSNVLKETFWIGK
jgi:hypothetical protein